MISDILSLQPNNKKNNTMRRILYYVGFLIMAIGSLQAQRHLTLSDAMEQALSHNESLSQAVIDAQIAKEQGQRANAIFMPQIDMAYTALVTNNPLNSFGFKLNQEVVTQADFNPMLLNDPGTNRNFSAELQLRQPLLNLDGIYQRQSARAMSRVKRYSQQRQEEYLRFKIKKAYMQIALAYKNKQMMDQVVAMAQSFADRAKAMHDEGLIQTADLLEAKNYLLKTQTQKQEAESGVANSCDQLSLLMGQTIGEVYSVDEIEVKVPDILASQWGDRSDIRAFEAGITAAQNNVRANKMTFLPRINAFGSYQFNDNHFAQFDANSYLVGITLSWKLFGGMQRIHNVRTARLNVEKMRSKLHETEQQAQVDYNQALRAYSDLNKEVMQVTSMVNQMEEAWRIQSDRYEQGLAPTSDLLRVQSQLAQQRLALAMTYFKRNVNMAWMQLITGK